MSATSIQYFVFSTICLVLLSLLRTQELDFHFEKIRNFKKAEQALYSCSQDRAHIENLKTSIVFLQKFFPDYDLEIKTGENFILTIQEKLSEPPCAYLKFRGYVPSVRWENNKNYPEVWPNWVIGFKNEKTE